MNDNALDYVWSFDDFSIGVSRNAGDSLSVRKEDRHLMVQRPGGLTQEQWYSHARDVCLLLNVERGRRVQFF